MSGGFSDLGLLPELLHAIDDLGWTLPTDIQDEAIPLILGGGDVMGAAETGSGKTAAFSLPLIQSVYERLKQIDETTKKAAAAAANDASTGGNNKKRKVDSVVSSPSASHEKQVQPITKITLNPNDRDQELQLTTNNMGCSYTTKGNEWMGARATHGIRSGKIYYEMKVLGKGNCRIGWSTVSGHLELGKDLHGFGYGGKGWKSFNGKYDRYGEEYTMNDYIGVYCDLHDNELYFSKNGKMLEKCYTIPDSLHGAVFFPTITLSNSAAELNFGAGYDGNGGGNGNASGFKYPPQLPGYVTMSSLPADQLFTSDSMECYTTTASATGNAGSSGKGSTSYRPPMALIIEPTRDLAEQVYQSILDLSKYIENPTLRTLLMIGDDAKTNVKGKLQQGVDIIVGTIGKIVGAIQSNTLDLSHVRFLVLDEADKLSSSDNIASIKQIFSKCPGGGTGYNRLQVCFFSATLHSPQIRELADLVCYNPTWIDLKGQETVVPDTLHHVILPVSPSQHYAMTVSSSNNNNKGGNNNGIVFDEVHTTQDLKDQHHLKSQRLKEMKPLLAMKLIDKFAMSQVLIFCRTNLDCNNLEKFFNYQNTIGGKGGLEMKYSCRVLGGMLSMEERRKNLQLFKENEIRILICTDVAARGIDIDSLPFVIQMTLPDEADDYIHRIGRVGRSDRMGLAISLVALEDQEKVWYHKCNNRGIGCTNRQVVNDGGCTIWYQESAIVKKIEQKIGMPLLQMVPTTTSSSNKGAAAASSIDWNLPEEIASLKCSYGEVATDSILHGKDSTRVYMTEHMIEEVKQLASLEMRAQNMYLRMNDLLSLK